MKTIALLLVLVALGWCQTTCPSVYGFDSTFSQTGTIGTGYLIGNNFTVTCDSQIVALNGNFGSTTGRFYLGVYTDKNGSPDALIAGTPANTYTANGRVRVVLTTPVNIAPGKYWFMAIYEQYSYPYYSTQNIYQTVKYIYTSFSSGLPSSLSGNYVYSYTGSTYNFWLETVGTGCPTIVGQYSAFTTFSSHSPNYILGNQINVTCDSYINALGVYLNIASGQFQLALYSDYNGNPYQLVAYTYATATKMGSNSVALYNPVEISPGSYWLMGFYSLQSYPGYNTSNSNVVVKYSYRTFSSGLPDYFGTVTTYTGQLFNYWLEMQVSSCPDKVGWPDIFYDVSSHSPNYLLGNAINITCASFVSAMNAYFSETTGRFMMGLYSDNNGNPDSLLISSVIKQTLAGEIHLALTPQYFLEQ